MDQRREKLLELIWWMLTENFGGDEIIERDAGDYEHFDGYGLKPSGKAVKLHTVTGDGFKEEAVPQETRGIPHFHIDVENNRALVINPGDGGYVIDGETEGFVTGYRN